MARDWNQDNFKLELEGIGAVGAWLMIRPACAENPKNFHS
jgi:hypothetical protein